MDLNTIVKQKPKRSNFNLSHDVKLSLDMGDLVPMYLQEVIPGDNIKINSTSMLRLAPLISPVMHKINVMVEYFFVPNRIIWQNWETYITGSRNGKELTPDEFPAFPTVNPYNNENFLNKNGSLSDYLGVPTPDSFTRNVEGTEEKGVFLNLNPQINALPFAAYQRIYDEYYRDQNLIKSLYDVDDVDGEFVNYNQLPDGNLSDALQRQLSAIRIRCWEHDYFTSALPWAQKGDPVAIPVNLTNDEFQVERINGATAVAGNLKIVNTPPFTTGFGEDVGDNNNVQVRLKDGSFVNTTTINDLRAAYKLQEWLETNARGGSRYFESIYAHFGLRSPDSRLQRPEFIGSNRSNMVISEVLQTSSPQGQNDTPQGNMSGHGQSIAQSRNFNYTAKEHGYIIGIISVLPKTAYFQGLDRHWLKTDSRMLYYFPEFAHLGEQEVFNAELYANQPLTFKDTFGYMPRYSEYKFQNSRVAGDFRDTLKYWHMARDLNINPKLNDSFVGATPTKRIFAVQDLPNTNPDGTFIEGVRNYHSIYAHVFHDVKASRLIPKYSKPNI